MDNEENKPGAIQIPLISDLVFDESLPLRPPRKAAAGTRKKQPIDPRRIPPGYDPDTGDLFGELDAYSPEEEVDDLPGQAGHEEEYEEQNRQLRAALKSELEEVLKSLK